jgi:cytosine/adenosine deaminase-related metal-dependent hydrolase
MADRKLIRDGVVLTLDRELGDFDRADVLVEDGKIAAVGPDLEAPEGAEVIDASRAIATIDGARACGLGDRIGTLTPGKQADIILLSTDSYGMFPANNPYGAVVYNAHPGVVDTILVAGNVVKRGGELLGPDRERVRRLAFESRDHIFDQARATPATADATTGGTWMPHHF